MIKKITALLFIVSAVIFSLKSLSFAGIINDNEMSPALSEKAFYSSPDNIINEFIKNGFNTQNNYILAGAYKKKKELKKSLLYYTNSCFNNKFNFNIRLFPGPVFLFTESQKDRSIFYNDSVYNIALLFYDYAEHEYVLKFISLLDKNDSSLFRESIILKSKSLVKLGRYKEAIEELQQTIGLFRDKESRALLYLRLGSVYESAGDTGKALDSYFDVIRSQSGVWQNRIAAERLLYITENKKTGIGSSVNHTLFATALYDARQYAKALDHAEQALRERETSDILLLIVRILSRTNATEAAAFIKKRENKSDYEKLLMEHADIIRQTGRKTEAVRIYKKLINASDTEIKERVLTILSFYYEQKNDAEFIKYMEMYIEKFPENDLCGRYIWLMGRYYIKKSQSRKAAEYFRKGIENYPANSFTPYSAFWLRKLVPDKNEKEDIIKFLEELNLNNPDSYHTLSLLKKYSEKFDISALTKEFNSSVTGRDEKKMLLFHTLLFMKSGYDNSHKERLKQFSSSITEPYRNTAELINKPVYNGNYNSLIKRLEVYFYAGDINAINRELKLIPDNDLKGQMDAALALIIFSKKQRNYNLLTFNGFRLLRLMNLKENVSLIPREFAEILYPYAFKGCIEKESNEYSVKPELILSMIKAESNFNHKAISSAGASGLMQLMPQTAKEISKKLGIQKFELSDPCISIKFGTYYIAWLDRYYKDIIEYMIAAYNSGKGNVSRWLKETDNKDLDYFSEFTPYEETRDYILRTKKFLIQYESIYKKPGKN